MNFKQTVTEKFCSTFLNLTIQSTANAYPIFAQQGYPNPREANGRIVCANCHLENL
jgi:hypothetical protein